jgi:hypothetical protein
VAHPQESGSSKDEPLFCFSLGPDRAHPFLSRTAACTAIVPAHPFRPVLTPLRPAAVRSWPLAAPILWHVSCFTQ